MVRYGSYIGFSFGSGFIALLAFFILQWLNIPVGNLVDWLIGIASFWWLLAVVTIPWNVYFEAEEVKSEAAISRTKKIPVDEQQLRYVMKVSRWSLLLAIALHLVSAIGLYTLAAWGISAVGYVSSFATLLLTALRPAVRAYQYLVFRLTSIRKQITYPREDVLALKSQVNTIEATLKEVQKKFNSAHEQNQQEWTTARQNFARLQASLEQFHATNEAEHHHLRREAEGAIAQLTEDSQAINHLRELIRFWKTA